LGTFTGKECYEDSRRIAQIVDSVGDKRQTVRGDTAYELNDSYRKIKKSRPKQLGSLHIIGMMMVVVVMTVTVVMRMVAMLVVCVHIVIVFK